MESVSVFYSLILTAERAETEATEPWKSGSVCRPTGKLSTYRQLEGPTAVVLRPCVLVANCKYTPQASMLIEMHLSCDHRDSDDHMQMYTFIILFGFSIQGCSYTGDRDVGAGGYRGIMVVCVISGFFRRYHSAPVAAR